MSVANWFGVVFFFSSRRRHTRCSRDWSSDVCSSDLPETTVVFGSCRRVRQFVMRASFFHGAAKWFAQVLHGQRRSARGFRQNTQVAALVRPDRDRKSVV